MAQTQRQKAAWVAANKPDARGYTPAQRRMLEVMFQLRLRTNIQQWHTERAIAHLWQKHGHSPYAPLWSILMALKVKGNVEVSLDWTPGTSGLWRLRSIPPHLQSQVTRV